MDNVQRNDIKLKIYINLMKQTPELIYGIKELIEISQNDKDIISKVEHNVSINKFHPSTIDAITGNEKNKTGLYIINKLSTLTDENLVALEKILVVAKTDEESYNKVLNVITNFREKQEANKVNEDLETKTIEQICNEYINKIKTESYNYNLIESFIKFISYHHSSISAKEYEAIKHNLRTPEIINKLNTFFANTEVWDGTLDFGLIPITDTGKLKVIKGDAIFFGSNLSDLGNIEVIEGAAVFSNSNIKSLNKLKYVGGTLEGVNSSLELLGNLEEVKGSLYLPDLKIKDICKIMNNKVKVGEGITLTLFGKTYVFYNANEIEQYIDEVKQNKEEYQNYETEINTLKKDRLINYINTIVNSKYNSKLYEEFIRFSQKNRIIINQPEILEQLQIYFDVTSTWEGNIDFGYLQISSLGNLKTINGNVKFGNSSIQNLERLEIINGSADFSESDVNNLSHLREVHGDIVFDEDYIPRINSLEIVDGEITVLSETDFISLKSIEELKALRKERYKVVKVEENQNIFTKAIAKIKEISLKDLISIILIKRNNRKEKKKAKSANEALLKEYNNKIIVLNNKIISKTFTKEDVEEIIRFTMFIAVQSKSEEAKAVLKSREFKKLLKNFKKLAADLEQVKPIIGDYFNNGKRKINVEDNKGNVIKITSVEDLQQYIDAGVNRGKRR